MSDFSDRPTTARDLPPPLEEQRSRSIGVSDLQFDSVNPQTPAEQAARRQQVSRTVNVDLVTPNPEVICKTPSLPGALIAQGAYIEFSISDCGGSNVSNFGLGYRSGGSGVAVSQSRRVTSDESAITVRDSQSIRLDINRSE